MGKIYTLEGEILDIDKLYHGNEIFEKVTNNLKEIKICEILMRKSHTNIVKIYEIGVNYIDMELLNINLDSIEISKIKEVMRGVKDYLQSLGIMYIDWKLDNIGINNDSNLKLFDFDVSGMIDTNNGEWITKMAPPKYYSFNEAVKAGMITPIEIDNYAFELGFNSV